MVGDYMLAVAKMVKQLLGDVVRGTRKNIKR